MMTEFEETVTHNGGDQTREKVLKESKLTLENVHVETIIDGIMEVEFSWNGQSFCGTVFSKNIDQKTLSHSRVRYEQYEALKTQPRQKSVKKKRGRQPGRKKQKATLPAVLSSKISRELDELISQGDQTPSEERNDSKVPIKIEVAECEDCIPKEGPLSDKNISPSELKEEQYSDISDASKESCVDSHFAIKNLCAPEKRTASPGQNMNPRKIPTESPTYVERPTLPPWPNAPFNTKVADNYTILKENREMSNSCRFSTPVDTSPLRPPTFSNNPRPRGMDNLSHRFFPMNNISVNNQRLLNPTADMFRFYSSLINTVPSSPNQMANLMAYCCNPYFMFQRGVQSPVNNPQANIMAGLSEAMRPLGFMQGMPRFPPNNPRNQGNSNVNGSGNVGRE